MARVSIVNVEVEVGKPGPRGWQKAVVTFQQDGRQLTQNVMSFTNPQVFKDVQKFVGTEVDVEIVKNEKGYNEWKQIKPAEGSVAPSAQPQNSPSATRVTGSNYETKEERARRQVLIVRQSSLSNAIEALNVDGKLHAPEEYTDLAETFAEWVFQQESLNDEEDAGPTA